MADGKDWDGWELFFLCISKIISGSEKHYTKLRAAEVCRYIVTLEKPIINRNVKTIRKDASPVSYLKK